MKSGDTVEGVALVSGASRGIGRAVAHALAGAGAQVAICGRNTAALDEAAGDIRGKTGADVLTVAADLATPAGVAHVVETTHARFGRIDVLVNNAGAIRAGDFLTTPDEQWMEDWSLKLFGYVRMARSVFPLMRAQGGGRIVNVVGITARNPVAGYLAGGMANAALVNFTKGLADLGAPAGILVTAVSPGATATSRWDAHVSRLAVAEQRTEEAVRREREGAYPLGRIGTPEDVAAVVRFLASPAAAFVTGICVTVDGGATRGVYP